MTNAENKEKLFPLDFLLLHLRACQRPRLQQFLNLWHSQSTGARASIVSSFLATGGEEKNLLHCLGKKIRLRGVGKKV